MASCCLLECSSFVWAKDARLLISGDGDGVWQDLRLGSPARLYIFGKAIDPLECMVHHSSLLSQLRLHIAPPSLP